MLATIVICFFVAVAPSEASVATVPKAAARLVAPVLQAMISVRSSENEQTLMALDDAVERVCNRNNRASDEALAVLIEFYVGEHSGEDISCELVRRGMRVLPLLAKYHHHKIVVPGVDMSRTEPLDTLYDDVRERIHHGEHCERER
jgi:hypothetical protein